MSGFFAPTANALTTLTVTSPNGTEEWRGIQNITWTSTGGAPSDLVDIVYSTDAFSSQAVVATGVLNNTGSYSWDTTSFPESGTYLVRFLSNPGALVYDTSNNVFMVDNTAPVTALATTTGTLGLNGYYMGPSVPTFDLNCTDALSGCLETYYQLDGGGYLLYAGTFPIPNGVHTLEWFSRDQAVNVGGFHNTEVTHSQVIKVDTVVPTVAVTSSTLSGAYNVPDAINVTLTFNEDVTTTDTITVTLETGATDRTCIVPIMTNATVGTCTYTVQAGDTSADLTTNSIAATMGSVLDIAGNTANLSPTSNLADTSAIVVDTTAPSAFTTGAVTITGGTVVATWWNSTNTGATVAVPFAADPSLTAGVMQLQAEADGTFENIGSAWEIMMSYPGNTIAFPLTASQIEALAGFSEGDVVTFRAIITDIAGNATTGGNSANTFTVDQTAPTVNAGTDKEVRMATPQDAATGDPLPASGIATWAWTANSGNVGFTSASTEDTDISATSDGTYTVTLTVTDTAGNSNSDTMTFVWDTTDPVLTAFTLVPTPTNDTSPSYTFSVDKAAWLVGNTGTINITGSCGAWTPSVAVDGNNTVTFTGPLSDAMYTNCDITVTDAAGNMPGILEINNFEIDTIMAAVSSITTTDVNLDGMVDTATIVFTDEMKDSTFVAGNFTIGGVVATTFTTGTANDATVTLSHGGVAGTESKTVTYTPGTVTDLAGNIRTGFTSGSIDEAKPVLLSARTISTTQVTATFSENLNGSTVNGGGGEFTVAGTTVTGAFETADGVVTLTYAPALGTGATPLITYTQVDQLNDPAPVPNTAVTPVSVTAVDGVAPTLSSVTISSDNDGNTSAPEWAIVGNTATLTFTSSESIAIPTVLIDGMAAIVIGGPTAWTATYTFVGGEADGTILFSIVFADLVVPTPNTGTTVTATSDGSTVFFDEVAPTVDAGTDKEVNAVVSQNAIATDAAPSSGILSYLWTNQTPGVGLITFGSATTEDTTISANTDGTYTIRLTVTDNAGNIAFNEMTFIWDTTNPVAEALVAPEPQTGVLITAGTAKVRFDEPIVLLATSRVVLKNNSGTSYKGIVAVDSGDSKVLNIAYSGLAYGTVYDVIVKPDSVRDVAGNNVSTSFTAQFTTEIDTVVPVVNSASASGIATTGATLNVTTDESATCRYATTDSAYGSMMAFDAPNTGTSHTVALTGLMPSTGYDYFVRCADTSAQTNTMTTSAHISFTTATPDTTPPAIKDIQATSISDTGATIEWETDEIATSRVEYGLTSAYGSMTAVDATPDLMSHSVPLTGLTPGTTYHFRVLSDDAEGMPNVGVSDDNTFTTTDTTDPATPAFTTANATIDADTYTIAGTIATDGGMRTVNVYNGATLAGTVSVPVYMTTWSLLVSLTQNSANVFTATASDDAGNTSGSISTRTITEATATGDTDAPATPVISGSDETVDADNYTISGTAGVDLPADGTRVVTIYRNLSYGPTIIVGSLSLLAGETDWSFVAPLVQNIANSFTANSTDEAGNTSAVSNIRIITEVATLDTTAPVITLLGVNPQTLTVGGSYVELGATASDNVDGDISGSLVINSSAVNMAVAGTYTVTYNVSDDAGNDAEEEKRTVIVNAAFDDTAGLAVTGIDTVRSFATADNTFPNGWAWKFHVTVPTSETSFAMKFGDFLSGANSVPAATNIRIYSAQSPGAFNGATAITITAANTYSANMTLATDLESGTAGRQIEVMVEVRVPVTTVGGSYSTSYGVQSLETI